MRFLVLLIVSTLLITNLLFAQSTQVNSMKAVINISYGELTFFNLCKRHKLSFIQSKKPLIDNAVETEANDRDISKDKLKLRVKLNKQGSIISYKIIRKAKLKSFNIFVSDIFHEVIEIMANNGVSLSCSNEEESYKIKVTYARQKKK